MTELGSQTGFVMLKRTRVVLHSSSELPPSDLGSCVHDAAVTQWLST